MVEIRGPKRIRGLHLERLRGTAERILKLTERSDTELSLTVVRDRDIRRLNRRYRGKDSATDVLSFFLQDDVCPSLLGDVVISVDSARRQAKEREVSVMDEVENLLIHGILHLLGYNHEASRSQARRMHRKAAELKRLLHLG